MLFGTVPTPVNSATCLTPMPLGQTTPAAVSPPSVVDTQADAITAEDISLRPGGKPTESKTPESSKAKRNKKKRVAKKGICVCVHVISFVLTVFSDDSLCTLQNGISNI